MKFERHRLPLLFKMKMQHKGFRTELVLWIKRYRIRITSLANWRKILLPKPTKLKNWRLIFKNLEKIVMTRILNFWSTNLMGVLFQSDLHQKLNNLFEFQLFLRGLPLYKKELLLFNLSHLKESKSLNLQSYSKWEISPLNLSFQSQNNRK